MTQEREERDLLHQQLQYLSIMKRKTNGDGVLGTETLILSKQAHKLCMSPTVVCNPSSLLSALLIY